MEREKCEFDICNDPLHMFLFDNHENPKLRSNKIPSGWVSYRHVICRAIWYNIINFSDEEIIQKLLEFTKHFGKKESYKEDDHFFHIRAFKEDDELLIIDKTHGCYPLLIDDKKGDGEKSRYKGFESALKEVWDKRYKILSILRESKAGGWSVAVEERLRKDLPWDIPESNQF